MIHLRERLIDRARRLDRRIAFPEGDDPRVINAAYKASELGMVRPLLIATPADFETQRAKLNLPEPDFEILDPRRLQAEFAESVFAIRKHKGITHGEAKLRAADRTVQAALMLRTGRVDGVVAGAIHTTAATVRAGIQFLGMAPGIQWVSSFFAIVLGHGKNERMMLYADCGVLPEPNEDQLVAIANASIRSWRQLQESEPRVAFLAFSTKGSAEHASLVTIREALARVHAEHPQVCMDGELQVDAALVPHVAAIKAPSSPVEGRADVLIFPNLHAGNIAYKLTERLAGAVALGPILQGLDKPMNDLSRGCNAEDVLLVAAITAVQGQADDN